ncbi:glutathione S-transferase family protein [Ketobacter sp.]
MDLYFAYLSTYSQKTLLGLYERGVEFTPHLVDLTDPDARAEYHKLYPFGKVPLLIREDGRMIPESSIILEYIDTSTDGGPFLIPKDPELSRRVRFLDRMCDLYLNDPVVSLIFESWKPTEQQNLEMMQKASEKIGIMYRFMEDQLQDREFLAGDAFSMADCSALPVLYYAKSFAPFAESPNIQSYWDHQSKRDAFLRVKAEAEPYITAVMGER